jgi:toxin ParE1/3/4
MGSYVLRPKAVEDLDSIWEYTINAWGEEQAERYIRLLTSGFEEIAEEPIRGRLCNDIREGYWKLRIGHHVIFYRTEDTGVIDVVRVLHEKMDFARHL